MKTKTLSDIQQDIDIEEREQVALFDVEPIDREVAIRLYNLLKRRTITQKRITHMKKHL